MIIYLAHPIDYDDGTKDEIFQYLTDRLAEFSEVLVFDPATAWHLPKGEPDPVAGLQDANVALLATVDLMIAYLRPSTLTIGTPIEIALASNMGKPVLVLTPGVKGKSWVLASLEGVVQFTDPQSLLIHLDQILDRDRPEDEQGLVMG